VRSRLLGSRRTSPRCRSCPVRVADLRAAIATLGDALAADAGETPIEEAQHAQEALLPAMAAVRSAVDTLEGVVADDLWPLPTYQEMLFIL